MNLAGWGVDIFLIFSSGSVGELLWIYVNRTQIKIKAVVPIFNSVGVVELLLFHETFKTILFLKKNHHSDQSTTFEWFYILAIVSHWNLSNILLGGCGGVAFLVWSSVDILCCGSKWFLQSENLSCGTEKRFSFFKVNNSEQIFAKRKKNRIGCCLEFSKRIYL